ncbi:MAG: LPS assembly protein LptD [Candidatus Firestonebacteria bacterium]
MKTTRSRFIISGLLLLVFFNSLKAQKESSKVETGKKTPIDCVGDYMEYDEANGAIYARGNVIVKYKEIILKADKIRLSTKSEDIEAEGNISLTDKDSLVTGKHIKYNLKLQVGSVDDIECTNKPWFFKGESIDRPDPKNANINNGFATTCNIHEHPHYRMASRRIHLLVGEKVESWDTVFYLGDIPVLYLPYYFKDLKTNETPLSLRPGFSNYEGRYLKCAYNYRLNEQLPGSLLLDLMTVKGVGYGWRQSYTLPELNGTGSFYTYYINEADSGHERWNINLEHRSDIVKDLNIVGRLDYFSDLGLLKDYYSYYYPVLTSNVRAYAAVTKYDPSYSIVLSADRQDDWNSFKQNYILTAETMPSIKLQTNTAELFGSGFYGTLSAEAVRSYVFGSDYYASKVSVSPTLSKTFSLVTGHTLGAAIYVNSFLTDRFNPALPSGGFSFSYTTGLNIYNKWTQYFSTELGHSFTQRLTSLPADPYNGVDFNKVSARMTLAMNGFSNTTTTGYDLRLVGPFDKARFDNLYNQTLFVFSDKTDANLNLNYSFIASRIISADTAAYFNRNEPFNFGAGLNFAAGTPDIVDANGSAAFNVSSDLRLDLSVRYDLNKNFIKEYRVKALVNITDCWSIDGSYLNSLGTYAFTINFNLRAFKATELDQVPKAFTY